MNRNDIPREGLSRRQFIQAGLTGGAAMILGPQLAFAADDEQPAPKADVWVFHGENKTDLMKACLKTIAENGGFGDGAKKLTLKVNGAWVRTPVQGANTHPELVEAFLKGCKDQGIKELVLPEHACAKAEESFKESGILAASIEAGGRMVDLQKQKELFRNVEIPAGQKLKEARVAGDFMDTDVLVNMPVVKHHGSAAMTSAMKNWMGAIEDRGFWHHNNLHQCIADFSTFIKPRWTILDATRIMLTRGPQGPSDQMKIANLLIVSRDQVAADTYAASLFPEDLQKRMHYLRIAGEMKIGVADMSRINVHKAEVA